jgi:hypothetical protein
MSNNYQVTIHIVDKPLQFESAAAFAAYVEGQQKQGGLDEVGQPVWKKFAHLPLLFIVDDREGKSWSMAYRTPEDFPQETVKNDNGDQIIIIG